MPNPELAPAWTLDPSVTFLNHGSFGACPAEVLATQAELRARLEREPVRFMLREAPELLDAARHTVARFVGADPEGVAFVRNATEGINAVLRSLELAPGDELVVCDHEYGATRNTVEYVACRAGARVVEVSVPFPGTTPDAVVDAFAGALTDRTRLVVIDHVTSPTGLVMPVAEVIAACDRRGVDVLVDGAHAIGMLPLDLDELGAAYYTTNAHKWLCAPKGAAILSVRADRRDGLHPTQISHGYRAPLDAVRSRFRLEFDWTGTDDPTSWLAIPKAIEVVGGLVPGGWPEVMRRNHDLALRARGILMDALDLPEPPCPDAMIGALVALPLPDGDGDTRSPLASDALQDALLFEDRIEVPIVPWPRPPKRLVRVAAQLYNAPDDYERLAQALARRLRR